MKKADLVLFIVDCSDGLNTADKEIALLLRKNYIKTVLVANKADNPKADLTLADFSRSRFRHADRSFARLNARNIEDLVETISKTSIFAAPPTEIPQPQLSVAIVGKRNAGKSTLVNAIALIYEDDPQRVIVSEVPGTTRDSVDVRFEKDGQTLLVIDTAGVRKKKHMVTNDIEFYSFHRAQRSIRRADVVLMLIDGTDPLSQPDHKLSQYIAEQEKPVLLVVNKWDLSMVKARKVRTDPVDANIDDEQLMREFKEYLHTEMPQISYAPVAFITAKDGKNRAGRTRYDAASLQAVQRAHQHRPAQRRHREDL